MKVIKLAEFATMVHMSAVQSGRLGSKRSEREENYYRVGGARGVCAAWQREIQSMKKKQCLFPNEDRSFASRRLVGFIGLSHLDNTSVRILDFHEGFILITEYIHKHYYM
jgi:hypothetical protein